MLLIAKDTPLRSSRRRVSWVSVSPAFLSWIWRATSASMALLIAEKELIFLSSTLVPKGSSTLGLIETFTSTLICPFSISASEISFRFAILWISLANSTAASAESKSGQVTISIRGVPARLKSRSICPPWWNDFAVSHSKCASVIQTFSSFSNPSKKKETWPLTLIGV